MDFPFLELLARVQHMDYETLWRLLLLGCIRLGPIVSIAPFLGAKLIPGTARMALVLTLSILFLPTMMFHSTHTLNLDVAFIGYSIKELLIGFIIGYVASIPFFIAQSSGIIIDYMRGSSMLMAQDPSTQNQASPIGILLNYYLIVLFYQLDGPFLFFDALTTSFELIPVDAYLNPQFFALNNFFWQNAVDILGKLFALSIQLAAPAIIAILMAEMFLGIANRLAPQVQIAFLGMSLKSLLGLLLLWAGWFVIVKQFSAMSIDWVKLLSKMISQFSTA